MLLLSAVIVLGTAGGVIARLLKLPALTGQIAAGMLLGSHGLGLVTPQSRQSFHTIILFALCLVAFTIGGHLEFHRLHNAKKRIILIAIAQTVVVFSLVLLLFQAFNPFELTDAVALPIHLVLASIGTATSSVSILHIVKEKQAKGLLVKTAMAVIGVSNLFSIVIFGICRALGDNMLSPRGTAIGALFSMFLSVLLAAAIGIATGFVLAEYCRHLVKKHKQTSSKKKGRQFLQAGLFTGLLVALSFCAGLCTFISTLTHELSSHLQLLSPSPILASICLGLVLANRSSFKEDVLKQFDALENAMFTCFFVLAGTHFNPEAAEKAIGATLFYFTAMTGGKWIGGMLGGSLSGSTGRLTANIGRVLLIQASLAVALLVVLEEDPVFLHCAGGRAFELVTACILSSSVASELIGGILLGHTLDKAGETGQDRTRLIEFLSEEFIIPSLKATDKWDALNQLCYYMARLQPVEASPDELFRAVKKREEGMSTAIGEGIAVPHAKIKKGGEIYGVMARLEPPLDFEALDEEPVRLVVLVATPENLEHKHLQVISAIAGMMQHESIRNAIFEAKTAEEIHEIIKSEEAETFNYFLDE